MTTAAPAKPAISTFERYLSVWVALCIVVGITLGSTLPGLFGAIAAAEVARGNLVVAVLIWLMIIPMLLKIDLRALGSVRQHWKGVGVTLFHQLGGEAVFDGYARHAVPELAVPALAAG